MSSIAYCKVYKCRFAHSHVTAGHKCGTCGCYGHGIVEHGNTSRCQKLKMYFDDRMPTHLACTRAKCNNSTLHMTSGHICELCNKNTHSEANCEQNNEFIIRKETELHATKKRKIIKLDCQICSVENYVNLTDDVVFGIDTLCKICCDNIVELRLPVCKHTMMCISCAIVIGTEEKQSYSNFTETQPIYDPILPEHNDKENRIHTEFFNKCAGNDGKIFISIVVDAKSLWYAKRDGIGELPEFIFVCYNNYLDTTMIKSSQEFVAGYKFIC